MIHTVLVVDDYEPWRRHIRLELHQHPRWRVIAEAADGPDAVHAAQALTPDLILLDIGLPTLNGLDVARRLLADRPDSRILFLTAEPSADVADAALSLGEGARGYLLKTEGGGTLLLALETVVNGGRFVSAGLIGQVRESTRAWTSARTHRHEAGFYSSETTLIEDYARLAEETLGMGNPFIVVADGKRRRQLQQRLQASGSVDLRRAIKDGRYLSMDAAPEISTVIAEGIPDEASFRASVATLIDAAAKTSTAERPRVAICGECSPGLWNQGFAEAAVGFEHRWDELAKIAEIHVLCGYVVDVPHLDDDGYAIFQRICAEHDTIHVR